MNTMKIKFLYSFFIILMSANIGIAQDIYDEMAQSYLNNLEKISSLKNIKSLKVKLIIVENLVQAGLNKSNLKSSIEAKIRKAGINISTQQEPYLEIFVNAVKIDNSSFSYSIDVTLQQNIILERDKSIKLITSTWERGAVGSVGTARIDGISETVSRFVDEFVKDYLTANNLTVKQNENILSNPKTKQDDSPFTATYIGENRPPEVEIFNDSDRTLYLDFGQNALTPYTISPKTSKKFTLTEGLYKYKATAPRVVPLAGEKTFEKGYRYTWRFVIITRKIN